MSDFQEKIPKEEKVQENTSEASFSDEEVEVIEPDSSILDAHINKKKDKPDFQESKEHLRLDDKTELIPNFDFSSVFIEPPAKFINTLLESNEVFSELTDKQIKNLRNDFNRIINSLGSSNPVMKVMNKIAKKSVYAPFLMDILGILGHKGLEFKKYKKGKG